MPISKGAQKIASTLDDTLFHWSEKQWWKNNEELNQRIQARNDLWLCFGTKHSAPNTNLGRLECGKIVCKPKNIRLNTFLHTFAMWKLAAGCPLEVIKDLMGHKSIRMAELHASQRPNKSLIKYVK